MEKLIPDYVKKLALFEAKNKKKMHLVEKQEEESEFSTIRIHADYSGIANLSSEFRDYITENIT